MKLTRREKEQQIRRQYIIDAAEDIFAKKGYENTSMNEIAVKAEFTKRTLYKYFDDKADLFLAVLVQKYSDLASFLKSYNYEDSDGYNTVRQGIYAYYEYYKANSGSLRIIFEIGKVRSLTDNPKITEFVDIDMRLTEALTASITRGKEDGSITTSSDAISLTLAFKFLLTGFFNQLTVSGESYSKHNSLSLEEFATGVIEMILKTLKC